MLHAILRVLNNMSDNVVSIVILFFIFGAYSVICYEILAVFAHPGKSHVDVYLPITKALAEKGHNVIVISHYPVSSSMPNYQDIDLKDQSKQFVEAIDVEQIDPSSKLTRYMLTTFLEYLAQKACKDVMQSKNFQRFMKERHRYHFDLMIIEMFNTDCLMGLADIFNVPVIGLSSCTLMPWASDRFANPIHTGYIPNNLLPHSDRMNFLERVENTVVTTLHRFFYRYVMNANDENIARKYLGEEAANMDSAINRSSLLLVNTHFSLNLPRPFVPNVIEIGGVHVGEPKPLPQNLQKWINESTHGVIYMSLGSLLRGHTLPKDKREAIQKAFSRLPQRIIWKWENDTMEGQPKNAMLLKWAPQFDILSHPNVKAFISHGGLLGTIEGVHSGTPIVVIPQFGDQHTNAKAIQASGGGVILNYRDITEQTIYEALKTVLDET
ncbi:unnamed protein product [Acanthoscelides obtectus]|nr:unnamed protein product [Acanthoscelides obtectus]CAK1659388.1 UDP-glucuronosyltransferase 1-10 [Acanthoscelides obtectus]